MTPQKLLETKLSSGLYSFATLQPDEQALLASLLRPVNGFTPEQRSLLARWRLAVPASQLNKINELNGNRVIKFSHQRLKDGSYVLPVDLLTDFRVGENFNHCVQWFAGLKIRAVLPEDFETTVSNILN